MDFQNKKVLIMGLGLHGGGVSSAKWLAKHGAKVTITDLKTKKELKFSIDKLPKHKIKFVLGQHRLEDFKIADLIIQNPGVPRESKYLKIAKQAGIPIENEASLFFKSCPGKIIGVTGTRGKSTTSALIYEITSMQAGKRQAASWLAGLPQQPMLEILDKVKENDIVALELSSWQLEVLGQHKLSPRISVVTNIYPDHLNRYSGMPAYIAAKKNIFKYQAKDDYVVLNLDNPETKKLGREAVCQRFWFSKKYFPEQNGCYVKSGNIYYRDDGKVKKIAGVKDIKLAGEHNLENVLAAAAVAGIYQVPIKAITSALKSFSGLPGRMELVKEIKGVKYINDTTATTPDGTIAALKQLASSSTCRSGQAASGKRQAIILIAGGDTKNIPDIKYKELANLIKKTCKAVVLFKGKGSKQILKFLKMKNLVSEAGNMADAVGLAKSFAEKGDTVLLSPGCASFNIFQNEFDRGEQFENIVNR